MKNRRTQEKMTKDLYGYKKDYLSLTNGWLDTIHAKVAILKLFFGCWFHIKMKIK